MDYSKKGIENKQNIIKSNSKRVISKLRITIFRLCILCFVSLIIVGSFAGIGLIKGLIDSAPDIKQINVVPQGFTTTVYDKEGNVIENLKEANSNRTFVELKALPNYVKYAFISIEDERFYEHNGIDIRGILRAAVHGITSFNFDEGASTITQQLLKNQVFDGGSEPTLIERVERKIQEQYLAVQLENILDKDTILEYYINTINLGSGTLGIQTAAKRYFDKDAKDLTLSEAATIAAITQRPVYLNPIKYPENNKERRDEILQKMLQQNHCSQEEYDEAMADDVYTRIKSIDEKKVDTSVYSYFVDELIDQVMNDLQKKCGYTQAQASNLIFSGGLSIYTTQDPVIQKICNNVYSDKANFPKMGISYWELTYALSIQKADGSTVHYHQNDILDYYKNYDDPKNLYVDKDGSKFSLLFLDKKDMNKKIKAFKKSKVKDGDTVLAESIDMIIQPQSSFVVMDQGNGQVQAIIGGRGEKSRSRTLNRVDRPRQPGSTFKILSTYLPALDTSGFTLASVQDDAGPYYYPGTKTEVNNWTGSRNYKGLTTLRQGIYDSMNIVTVKTMVDVTPQLGYDYLLKLGFTTLIDSRKEKNGKVVSDINPPLALGGLTVGVSNLELTAAYASIANDGVYTQPTFYTKILDRNGKVLINNKPKKVQVMKESTAWLLTSAMEDVVNKGTGTSLRFTDINMPVAGKTGSTSNYYDLWFSGYTPYYTASVWSGFDNNRTQVDTLFAKKIWKKIMEQIHIKKKLDTKTFTRPDSVVPVSICTKSGKLAVKGLCDKYEGGNCIRTEYFAKGTEPTQYCDVHVKVNICTQSKKLATDNCPLSDIKEIVLLNKKETSRTADTPYLLPKKPCNIHKGGIPNSNTSQPQDSLPENDIQNPNPETNDPENSELEDAIQNLIHP